MTLHQQQVAGQFGSHAAAYVSSPVHAQGADLDRLALLLAARALAAGGPGRVLDIGTGGGHAAFRAAASAREVVAYDVSPEMLAAVMQEAARRGIANLVAEQGAAEALPFPDAHFDTVISRFSAHHWGDFAQGLREARRVLKPGGFAVFIDIVAPESTLADSWLQTLELMRDASHIRDRSLSEWRAALAGAGFNPGEVTRYRLRMEFASWVARIGTPEPLVAGLRALQNQMPAEVAHYYELEADGSFTIDSALIEA